MRLNSNAVQCFHRDSKLDIVQHLRSLRYQTSFAVFEKYKYAVLIQLDHDRGLCALPVPSSGWLVMLRVMVLIFEPRSNEVLFRTSTMPSETFSHLPKTSPNLIRYNVKAKDYTFHWHGLALCLFGLLRAKSTLVNDLIPASRCWNSESSRFTSIMLICTRTSPSSSNAKLPTCLSSSEAWWNSAKTRRHLQ